MIQVQILYSLEIVQELRKLLGACREQWTVSLAQVLPIETIEPGMANNLAKAIFECIVSGASNTRFRSSKQARQKVDALGRQLSLDLGRNLNNDERRAKCWILVYTDGTRNNIKSMCLPRGTDAIEESYGK